MKKITKIYIDATHKVGLGTDLEGDITSGGLGVVNGLGTSLDVLGNLVVVRGGEGGEVTETVKGDGVLGGREADGTSVSGDGAGEDIVRSLGTNKETVTTDNGVSGEGGPLQGALASLLMIRKERESLP